MYKIRLYDKKGYYIGELWHDNNSPIILEELRAECRRQHLPTVTIKIVYVK